MKKTIDRISNLGESEKKYAVIIMIIALLAALMFTDAAKPFLFVASLFATLGVFKKAFSDARRLKITIDVFNSVALLIAFVALEIRSAAFIALMLALADLLEWKTRIKTSNAISELLKLKPTKALVEIDGVVIEVPADEVHEKDIVVIETGSRVPVDGVVIYGRGLLNEAAITGESALVEKVHGDGVHSLSINESGIFKIRATHVGKDSVAERIVTLMGEAEKNKSHSERIADRIAQYFLPAIVFVAMIVYVITKDPSLVASLFLVACADDVAVAVPLAMTASIGNAAKRGMIIRGGEWLDALSRVKTFVFDKTGTLTYGKLVFEKAYLRHEQDKEKFWKLVAVAEKFSEHPAGRAIFHEAFKNVSEVPDPESVGIISGEGIKAKYGSDEIILGNEGIVKETGVKLLSAELKWLEKTRSECGESCILVLINKRLEGVITVGDKERGNAKENIKKLSEIGISKIFMFTGDNEETASRVAGRLGIRNYRFGMKPEDKLREIEKLSARGAIAMIGDGINDAPSMARADVGIAMGSGATAVAVEAADIVVMRDNLSVLPYAVRLSKKVMSVIHTGIVIWAVSNVLGFALVFAGVFDPSTAAFYNLVSDFLPMLNSTRLFSENEH